MSTPWRIELFGGLRAVQSGRVITRFRTQKAALLLAFLALHAGQPQPRETLLDLLWTDEDLDASRNGLRVSLSSLRRQLEPPGTPHSSVLSADRFTITLRRAACSTDVADFWEALRMGDERAAEAVSLYGGELLPGFYPDWVLAERRRAAEAYRAALSRLTQTLTEAGRFAQAVDMAHLAVQVDPLDDVAHRALMRLHVAAGNPDRARRQYEELSATLAQIGVVPDDETRSLVESLGTAQASAAHTAKADAAAPITPQVVASMPSRSWQKGFSDRLPVAWNRFFGREEESAALCALARPGTGTRILTLSGQGGNGKTRLAVEAARQLLADYGGAVWFVPLADVMDGGRVGDAVRDVLCLPPDPYRDAWEQAAEALSGAPALLLLDNFEQVVPFAGPLVSALLRRCPDLTCLVTSRRRLDVPGEREFPVAPLPVPTGEETLESLARCAAAQLFADRAQVSRPDFALTERNAPDVAALCRDLEGIPLALELAAARTRAMTVAQMRPRLQKRFALLTAIRPGDVGRHRSLWAAMDWSYDLLPTTQQAFFARLSVFRGGWDLEAAEAVCGESHALDALTHLRTHSLLGTDEAASGLRFRLLETLREFAAAQLSPSEQASLSGRHADYFLALARRAEAGLQGAEQAGWLARLDTEHDNLRAALDWCVSDGGNSVTGLRLAVAVWRFWHGRGHLREGRERLTTALERVPPSPETCRDRASALNALGVLYWSLGDRTEARSALDASLCAFRTLGDVTGEASVLNNQGLLARSEGDPEGARAAFAGSLSIKRAQGDLRGIPSSLNNLGAVARDAGEYIQAEALFTESMAICRDVGDAAGEANAFNSLGNVRFDTGDLTGAREFYQESLALKRTLGNRQGVAISLSNLGGVALQQEDWMGAHGFLTEALEIFRALGVRQDVGSILNDLGRVMTSLGDLRAARAYLTESLALGGPDGSPQEMCAALESFAALAAAGTEWERAAVLLGASSALREARQAPREPSAVGAVERTLTAARDALGENAFHAAWARGRSLSALAAAEFTRQM